nr:flagellar hook basal-body protein [Methylobacterium sp. BTF04]
MFGTLSTSVSGLSAQSYALNNISGNIANASTPGFKSVETAFSDMLPDTARAPSLTGGVATRSRLSTDMPGTIATSDVPTNMAISGDGYFVVKQNTGSAATPNFTGDTLYTRRGDFAADADGYLVNGAGNYLLAGTSSTPLNLSAVTGTSHGAVSDLSISSTGAVAGTYADGTAAKIGQVTLAHFDDEAGLQTQDGGAYLATPQSGTPTLGLNGSTVTGGALEQSNANLSDQFSKMIVTQQAYSANTKVLTATSEMMTDVISMYV